jgi:hypothetical protein
MASFQILYFHFVFGFSKIAKREMPIGVTKPFFFVFVSKSYIGIVGCLVHGDGTKIFMAKW